MFDVFAMAVYTKNLVHTYSSASLHHIYQTIFQMEKGASTHTLEYAQFKLRYRFFPYKHREKEQRKTYTTVKFFVISTFQRYILCVHGAIQRKFNSILRSKYFNYKHVPFYLFRFFSCLLCLGILFNRAYQWFHIEFICSLIFIWNVVLFFCSSHSLTQWYKQKTYDCNNICTSYGDIWSITSQNWAKRWEWGNGFLSNISFPSWSQFIYFLLVRLNECGDFSPIFDYVSICYTKHSTIKIEKKRKFTHTHTQSKYYVRIDYVTSKMTVTTKKIKKKSLSIQNIVFFSFHLFVHIRVHLWS